MVGWLVKAGESCTVGFLIKKIITDLHSYLLSLFLLRLFPPHLKRFHFRAGLLSPRQEARLLRREIRVTELTAPKLLQIWGTSRAVEVKFYDDHVFHGVPLSWRNVAHFVVDE